MPWQGRVGARGTLLQIDPRALNALFWCARETEHVQVCMHITTSCVLLGGASFLQKHGAGLAGMLGALLGMLKERGTLLLLGPMEVLLQAQPADGPVLLEPVLSRLLDLVLHANDSNMVVAGGCSQAPTSQTVLACVFVSVVYLFVCLFLLFIYLCVCCCS
jgi:hypothetical protein